MPKQPSPIFCASYRGGWETEVQIAEKCLTLAIDGSMSHRVNICILVKQALLQTYPGISIEFIDWDLLTLTYLRPGG